MLLTSEGSHYPSYIDSSVRPHLMSTIYLNLMFYLAVQIRLNGFFFFADTDSP